MLNRPTLLLSTLRVLFRQAPQVQRALSAHRSVLFLLLTVRQGATRRVRPTQRSSTGCGSAIKRRRRAEEAQQASSVEVTQAQRRGRAGQQHNSAHQVVEQQMKRRLAAQPRVRGHGKRQDRVCVQAPVPAYANALFGERVDEGGHEIITGVALPKACGHDGADMLPHALALRLEHRAVSVPASI